MFAQVLRAPGALAQLEHHRLGRVLGPLSDYVEEGFIRIYSAFRSYHVVSKIRKQKKRSNLLLANEAMKLEMPCSNHLLEKREIEDKTSL
jgi:hypothetical protein